MEFKEFVNKMNALAAKAGMGKPYCKHDKEIGKYIAKFENGTKITGNPISPSLTVKWGSGHMAMATA